MTTPKVLFILVLSLLGACSRSGGSTTTPSARGASAYVDAASLSAQQWHLMDATHADGSRIAELFARADRPIQLHFADGRVGVSNACNHMAGSYTLSEDTVSVGDVMATEMACEEPLMQAESAMGRVLLGGGTLRFDGEQLLWTTPGGDVLRFRGEPTADTRYGGPGEQVFFEVAAHRTDCSHPEMPDYRCLNVRELHYDERWVVASRGEWQPLYQEIEGFTHAPGTRTVLRLRRYTIANPPADGSSVAYVLDMVVESAIE
jgi:heat shock protein HslJ